jgi:DNA mismatch endonuclease, patch repair protein
MARIPRRDTSPEVALRRALYADGLRYRCDYRTPSGRADVAFPSRRVVIFVDGCFWHGCPRHYVRPRTRCVFWNSKLEANVERDRRQTVCLEAERWIVIRLWVHDVVASHLGDAVRYVRRALAGLHEPHGANWRVVRAEPRRRDSLTSDPDRSDLERWTLQDLRDPSLRKVQLRKRTTHKTG